MQTHPEIFPPERRNDPKRRAEARVFDEIQRSPLPGFAHYEWQRDHRSPQLNFAVRLPEVGRFGLQVKGGHYSLQNGKWYLRTGNGSEKKDSPLRKTWDATMSLHDNIVDTLKYEVFFIAVLVFPDMEPDQAIAAKARRTKVHVIWGVDGLVDRLTEIAAVTEVYNPPYAEDIGREVAAVTDDQVLYQPLKARACPQRGPTVTQGPAGNPDGHRRGQHHHPARGHADRPHGPRLEPGHRPALSLQHGRGQ